MNRVLSTTIGVATVVAILVLSTTALGSPRGNRAAAGKSLIALKERGGTQMSSDKTLNGRFSLVLNGVIEDTGTTVIRPNEGIAKTVGGQSQTPVFGTNSLTTKKGTLTLSFRGVSIALNIDPARDPFFAEYGTWQITGTSGAYKGWKGTGRWASASTANANYIEWDGYISR